MLLLALILTLAPGVFTAPLASVPVIPALLLIGALGSFTAVRQLGAIVAAVIGVPARYEVLATAARTRSGRAHPPARPTVR